MNATSAWSAAHARFRPDAEALYDVTSGVRYTWDAFHLEVLRWTARLEDLGVGPGDRVAVLAQNRAEHFLLMLACAERGALFFPMNWRLSGEELAWQLGNAEPAAVFVDEANAGVLRVPVLRLDEGPGSRQAEGPGSAPEDPWVLMYTSGSSGKPKGALLSHRQIHWNALNTVLACDLTAESSTLTFTPLFHTGGLNCLSTPLLHRGGRVVLVKGVDPAQALKLIGTEKITHLMGVPTIYQMLADHPDFDGTDLSGVRDAICGGQALSIGLLERWLDRGVPLRQGFGMTEVGPNCFSMPPRAIRSKLGSVGLPIHHVAMRISRPDGSECAPGEAGELWMRGPAVFSGYFRNDAATAASFSGEWFRTGDVLTQDSDGFFWVSGRLKEMYKSGGENVYPAEVEAVLQQHPAVALAAVIGVPDEKWGEVGHAFVEPRPGLTVDAPALTAFLDGKLARFKQPKRIVVMEALPRTASGKIDKIALGKGVL